MNSSSLKLPKLSKKQCIVFSGKCAVFVDSFYQKHFITYDVDTQRAEVHEDNETNLKEVIRKQNQSPTLRIDFDAVFGFVTLAKHTYAILVTESKYAGSVLRKQTVWNARRLEFIPLGPGYDPKSGLKTPKADPDAKFIYLMNKIFLQNALYFSFYYDLTNSMQFIVSQNNLKPNSDFFFNEHFYRSGISNYASLSDDKNFWIKRPMILGFMGEIRVGDLATNQKRGLSEANELVEGKRDEGKTLLQEGGRVESVDASIVILARKEVGRLGARFFSRGIDQMGNVSNFVETEQIFRISQKSCHFVKFWQMGMTNGSFWW